MSLNIEKIQKDFPQVLNEYQGKVITYLDSAATTLKPQSVIDMVDTYYKEECANVHRGIHTLSEVSTAKYEKTREQLVEYIGAKKREEVIFTKGTTESINLVALSWGENNVTEGDEILISHMEHHSNIVPWQMLCERKKAILKIIPIDDNGDLDLEAFKSLINSKTKLLSVAYISNALGTINPVKELIAEARKYDTKILIDAAQAISHVKINVQELDCDFMAFSGHKMFGPTGVGVLYGKEELLETMPPIYGGGDMIDVVTFEKTTYNTLPQKLEAGTPNIAAIIGLSAAIDYINELGLENIVKYEDELLKYATEKLSSISTLRIVGTAKKKSAVISFVLEGIHPHDVATLANKYGIAVRTGHHCTQPLMKRMNVPATARASFSIYNTKADVDKLYTTLTKIIELFG